MAFSAPRAEADFDLYPDHVKFGETLLKQGSRHFLGNRYDGTLTLISPSWGFALPTRSDTVRWRGD